MTKLILSFCVALLFIGCNNNSNLKNKTKQKSLNGIAIIEYSLGKTFPHSIESYTEGLLFHDNKLYESTGSPDNYPNTRSVIGIVNLKTGKIDVKIEIDRNKYFGEGILFFNEKLYQLTYKNQIGFIYDSKDFKQIGTFKYSNKEGWGMTTDGSSIIMSDGTNFITYWDPDSLKEIKTNRYHI